MSCIDNFCNYIKNCNNRCSTFYLANEYDRHFLDECTIINHINSALDIFNIIVEAKELISTIEMILKIKYNLKIINRNPLKIRRKYLIVGADF